MAAQTIFWYSTIKLNYANKQETTGSIYLFIYLRQKKRIR